LAQFGWIQKPSVSAYINLFVSQFRAIRRLQPQRDLHELLVAIVAMLRARFRSNGYRTLLKKDIRDSTIYIPAQLIIDSLDATADVALEPVAMSLERALYIAEQPSKG
jgi:hypothetical protein